VLGPHHPRGSGTSHLSFCEVEAPHGDAVPSVGTFTPDLLLDDSDGEATEPLWAWIRNELHPYRTPVGGGSEGVRGFILVERGM
jgi:hypothetical protein